MTDDPIESLRDQDAAHSDPLGFDFINRLAARVQQQEGAVRRDLEARLDRAVTACLARCEAAGQGPEIIATQDPSAIAALRQSLDGEAGEGELKALRYFRDSWKTLRIDQQVAQAMAAAPENAGPLNSHQLMLRAIQAMQNLSPDYLSRFMTYADTLLWLDQAKGQQVAGKASGGEAVGVPKRAVRRPTGKARRKG